MRGFSIDEGKAKQLVEQFDVDRDGWIDVKEFELMLFKSEELKKQMHA